MGPRMLSYGWILCWIEAKIANYTLNITQNRVGRYNRTSFWRARAGFLIGPRFSVKPLFAAASDSPEEGSYLRLIDGCVTCIYGA